MFLKILAIAGVLTLCIALTFGVICILVNIYEVSRKMFYSILSILILSGWIVWSVLYLEHIPQ